MESASYEEIGDQLTVPCFIKAEKKGGRMTPDEWKLLLCGLLKIPRVK